MMGLRKVTVPSGPISSERGIGVRICVNPARTCHRSSCACSYSVVAGISGIIVRVTDMYLLVTTFAVVSDCNFYSILNID